MPTKDPEKLRAKQARQTAKRKGEDRHVKPGGAGAPFVGVDGEGGRRFVVAGSGETTTEHVYYLLRAGEFLLHTGKPLTARECLGFLVGLPKRPIYVAFAFDYDVTMMLRSLPMQTLRALVDRESRRYRDRRGSYEYRPIRWAGFEFDYIPRKEFKVRRQVGPGVRRPHWTAISDTFGHFQSSFVKALDSWNVGSPETRARIAADKARRSVFGLPDEREIAYNAEECVLLAQMMESVREACTEAGIVPEKWQGAGRLAGAMLKQQGAPRSEDVQDVTPPEVWRAARQAYYGGRFEVTRFGHGRDVHEYDIASAYPAAMTDLPCLLHGKWVARRTVPKQGSVYLARLSWAPRRGRTPNLGPFPIRRKDGRIVFPLQGRGWYWSVEVEAARAMGFVVKVEEFQEFVPGCDEEPFAWIPEKFAERIRLGKSGKGLVLKFALNSLYGKMAQTRPDLGPFANWVYAGLITAKTRAAVSTLCLEHDGACIRMLATDGVYCDHEIVGLDETPGKLGAWEHEVFREGFFAIMPGMYRKGDKLKTRGIPETAVKTKLNELIEKWDAGEPPVVVISRQQLQGLRLCVHRNRQDLMGQWPTVKKQLRIQMAPKRELPEWDEDGSAFTSPPMGSPDLESVERVENLAADIERVLSAMELEGDPQGITSSDLFDNLLQIVEEM